MPEDQEWQPVRVVGRLSPFHGWESVPLGSFDEPREDTLKDKIVLARPRPDWGHGFHCGGRLFHLHPDENEKYGYDSAILTVCEHQILAD